MRLLDIDPWTGTKEFMSYDEATDSLTIKRVQDVEPILDRNKRLANDGSHWKNQAKNDELGIDMRLVACIPAIVQEKWLRDHGVDVYKAEHWDAVKRLLNSSDWKWLKASDVTI